MAAKPEPTRKVTRDAGSGQFVPERRAKEAPTKTVTETVPVRKPGQGKS